jgi:hypothetical protein
MKHFLFVAASVGGLAIISPAWAQAPLPVQAPSIGQPYPAVQQPYRYTTPEDDYRNGLINRWQLERQEGPIPQALQGPNPSSNKGQDVK